jgi:ribonuclease M5
MSASKKHIKEIIVVEGRNDTLRLQSVFDCDTIETGGLYLDAATLDRIEEAARIRGIIVFTDPDGPGERIRRTVKARVPDAKHAFIAKEKARTDKKVGVEHAEKEDLENALANCVTFDERKESLLWNDFLDLGLAGNKAKRNFAASAFHIGPCNAKTCFKRFNQLGITKEQIEKLFENGGQDTVF